jgi:hypothetical protein
MGPFLCHLFPCHLLAASKPAMRVTMKTAPLLGAPTSNAGISVRFLDIYLELVSKHSSGFKEPFVPFLFPKKQL